MEARSRIRLGLLVIVLAASCGSRALTKDAGSFDAISTGGPGSGAGAGAGAAGAGGASAGSAPTGSSTGVAGQSGAGGGGGIGPGGRGGTAGLLGSAGIFGTGGILGTAGIFGTGGTGGRGGIGGSAGAVGRGGMGGSAGAVGMAGSGGSGGIGGRGGFIDTGGSGGGGVAGSFGGGGVSGRGGASGFGGGGVSGTFGTGGSGGTSGTSGGGTGGGGAGGMSGMGGTAGASGRGGMSGSGGSICLTCRANAMSIAARDIAYNALRNELYASVSGDAAEYPNTIVVIDPNTSSVTSSIPIGSNPNKLVVSDDGATLWVGMDGAHAFRKVTLGSTPVVGPLLHLPRAQPRTFYDVAAMAALPGTPSSIAMAMSDGTMGDVRVLDDGVARAASANNGAMTWSLTAGPPGLLFGTGSYGGLYVFKVGASGITQATPFFSLVRNSTSSLVYTGNKVFAQTGEVIDVSNPSAPFWTATLPYNGPVALRDAQSLLMLTTTNSNTFPFGLRTDIRVFSTGSQMIQTASVAVPASIAPSGTYYGKIVYAGNDAVAFFGSDYGSYSISTRLVIVHDPAFGTPTGGTGGAGGVGGAGAVGGSGGAGGTAGVGGTGGTGGAPNLCPGCSFASVPAYGLHMATDSTRNLIYLAAHAQALSHPSSIVTVDPATASVASIVPVGNDPQPLALSDDGSALWVGLVGEHRVRRMTPGTTPTPGPAYSLPMLLTTAEQSLPFSIVVLPAAPGSIAVAVSGANYGGHGVFILDDGMLRANFVQPPEIAAYYLTNGPPGYLLSTGDVYNNLVTFRLGAAGVTYETYGGLVTSYPAGLVYNGGYLYASTGEVVDLSNPDSPVLAGRFAFGGCALAMRSATRVMMLCPNPEPAGPILHVLDPTTFTSIGSLTLPDPLLNGSWFEIAYLGGDALALLPSDLPLQIMHAPLIGTPP